MPSKSKTKARKAAPKKAAKKAAKPRTRKSSPSKPKGKKLEVANHRFPPGTKISFLPVSQVTIERSMEREPFAKPIKTAEVGKDGSLSVSLERGMWAAAGEGDEGKWRYVQFSVK